MAQRPRRGPRWAALVLGGGLLAFGAEALSASQDGERRYRVVSIPEGIDPPKVDGSPNEAVWDLAEVLSGFTQVEPRPGLPESERTEIRMLRGARALYVAYYAYDSTPAGIRASQRARDANLDPDDRIEILFATLGDGRNGFWFQIGPAGGLGDALIGLSGSSFAKDWDGIWDARSVRTDEGWFAEFEIPFATLDFDPKLVEWRFNARRFVRRKEEESRWAAADPGRRFFAPKEGGRLEGMSGLERGLGLDVKPFLTARWLHLDDAADVDRLGDAGVDAFWRLGASAKLSLSLNTDFAEAEVDSRQVNLTRFPLFFPEKRDFFLEDSSAFLFGTGTANDVLPFFSRRIGLDADRRPVPVLAAGKFVWRTEDWSLGLLNAQIDDTVAVDGQNTGVVRVQRRIAGESDAGVIATHGNPESEDQSWTVGADLNLRTRELFGNRNARASIWWVGTGLENGEPDGSTSRGEAFSGELDLPNDRHEARFSYTQVDEDFEPALGFVRRPGTRTTTGRYSFRPRFQGALRRLEFSVAPQRIENLDGELETQLLRVTPLAVRWVSGDSLVTTVLRENDRPDQDFDLPGGLLVEAGDYHFTRYGLEFESSDRRPLAVELGFEGGGFFDGQRRDYSVGVTWFHSALWNFGAEYEWNDLRLASGREDVHVASVNALCVPTQDVSIRALLQYDSVSDDLNADVRMRWILEPGSEFFLVAAQAVEASSRSWIPRDAEILGKLGWTFRF